jgi:putative FmdB family regulatory protein
LPTYDYQCRQCGTTYEVIHSMLEEGPAVCERCGGELRRVLYPAGIIFKGSGFYSTDSRSGSSAATRRPGAPAASGGGKDGAASPPAQTDGGSSPSAPEKPGAGGKAEGSSATA